MNLDDKNIIDADDELFLNRMSSYFRRDRERVIFQDMVSNKIAATDFKSMSNIRNGNAGFSKLWFIVFSVFMLSTLLYFIYNDDFKLLNSLGMQGDNEKIIGVEKDKSNFNTQNISENLPNQKIATNEKRNKEKTIAIKGIEHNNKKSMIVSSEHTIERANEYKGKRISSSINISNDFPIDDLRNELSAMLVKFGFTLEKNIVSENSLVIKTNNTNALSKNGYPVEYNVNFIIEKNNPSLLKIYMEYFERVSDPKDKHKNISATGSTMEDMFYNKIANELINIIKN